MPTWNELKKFLVSTFRTLDLITPIATTSIQSTHKTFHVTTEEEEEEGNKFQSAHTTTSSSPLCTYCKMSGHYIYNCKDFVKQPVEDRHLFVRNNNICFNCLIPSHNVYKCKHRTTCRICGRKHHSLLHQVKETQPEPEHQVTNAHFSREQPGQKVLLATAQVKIKSRNGEIHTFRALIDQGSEASFISARAVELLGLARTSINGVVSGVGEGTQVEIKHLVDLTVTSRLNENEEIRVKAYVLKTISTILPSKQITMNWPEFQTIQLADPTYSTPGKIDILLGADVFCKIIEEGLVKMPDGVVAQKTSLGWILSGQKENNIETDYKIVTLHITSMVKEDNDMLKKFWEIESESYKKKKLVTKEEEACEKIYKETTTRDDSGRYTVHLPLKQSIEETVNLCGDTKQQAIKRFIHLEKRLQGNKDLKTAYTKVIQEYKDIGHMKKSDILNDNLSIYLPHHAVIREDKDTTKVRVVFNASAKGANGYSLNDTMMVGPIIQPDLRSLIISWRKHKICIVGDIIKMYRMINMTERHTNLQRIIWRDEVNEELESYNLMTVSFGTAAAPFLSVRTLSQLADDEEDEYPDSAPVIKRSFDLMAGHENVESTIKMCEDIKTILRKGGFEMQKWSSNSDEVLNYLGKGNGFTKDNIEIKLDKVIRILGLTWDRKEDTFKITVNLPDLRSPVTKRSILSDVARLFDPFGWLAPVVVTAKVMIQKLWLCSLGWDDELTLELKNEWTKYRQELIHLQNIKIPRWLKTKLNNKNIQLHGFADASTQAYAAVTYLRVVEDDVVHLTIVASRNKVAPLKQISIPKLELRAATLLTDLISDIKDLLDISEDQIFAWTDSMVVLSWLQSQPSRWRTFVANRVADITRVLDNRHWRYVQSSDNAADIATRGIQACDLADLELWWTGPEWLKLKEWEPVKCEIPETDVELKKITLHTTLQEKPIWERFSELQRLKRVLAYCRRMLKEKNQKRLQDI